MPMTGLTFQTGTVFSVDEAAGTCTIRSNMDGSMIQNVPLDSADNARFVPELEQGVLFMKIDEFHPSIVKYFGTKKFVPTAASGEAHSASKSNMGSQVLLDNGGNVLITDEFFSNVMQIIADEGIVLTADNYQLKVKNTGTINIDQKENKIEIIKTAGKTEEVKAIITIKDDKITIGSMNIDLGQSTAGGCVYSASNVPGAHSFCQMTGLPIPSSASIKVQK